MTTAQRLYAVLCALLRDALLLTDASGRILAANAAFARLIGYARTHAINKPITSLAGPGRAVL